jgi:uncharacterized protein
MGTTEDYWLAMSRGAKLVELDRAEALELLGSKRVGRVGFLSEDGPLVLPLNYLLVDECVIIRTVAFGILARGALDQRVAFEVDEIDDFLQAGWSVLVSGPAQLLSDAQLEQLRLGETPEPWAEGPRNLFLSIACQQVNGRRLLPQ